jgi:16S rRNA (cytidine1402-2'-O)-methyltransferase
VFFEAVHRMPETLGALVAELGAERRAVLARELTKVHEQTYAGTLAELASSIGGEIPLLGEFVIVIAGREAPPPPDESRAREVFELLRAELPPDKAVAVTAAITGLPRNAVYRLTRIRE